MIPLKLRLSAPEQFYGFDNSHLHARTIDCLRQFETFATEGVDVLIRAFASFWNPDVVDCGTDGAGNRGKLHESLSVNGQTKTVDFWTAKGIYVLHDEFKIVYLGEAYDRALGLDYTLPPRAYVN